MATFMLLLHERPEAFRDMSPAEMQGVIERYTAWAQKIEAEGRHQGGHKLTDDGGRWLSRNGSEISAVDGPFAEADEVVGGYFLIRAEDMAEAEQVAGDCPHLDYHGRIEIRQIDEMAQE